MPERGKVTNKMAQLLNQTKKGRDMARRIWLLIIKHPRRQRNIILEMVNVNQHI